MPPGDDEKYEPYSIKNLAGTWLIGVVLLVVLGILVAIFGDFEFPPAGRLICMVVVLTPIAIFEGVRLLLNWFRGEPSDLTPPDSLPPR